jgi:integrase
LARFGHKQTAATKKFVLHALADWLLATAGVRDVADIRPTSLVRWRDHVLRPDADGHELSTRNRWLAASGAFLRWVLGQGMAPLLTGDAIAAGTRRAKQPQHEIEYLRPEAIKALLTAALAHDRDHGDEAVAAFVLALLMSGARFEEMRGLRWDAVDLQTGNIRFQAGDVKTRRGRTVTLAETPSLLALLTAMAVRRGKRTHVFDIANHGQWDRLRKSLVTTYKAPPFSAHVLRRTCGTVLTCAPGVYGGSSAYMSARRLGHSVVVAERSYAGVLTLPASARTFEAAADVEAEANAIVAAAGGVVRAAEALAR